MEPLWAILKIKVEQLSPSSKEHLKKILNLGNERFTFIEFLLWSLYV